MPKKNNPTVRGPCGETNLFNSLSSTYFMHNKFPEDYDKMNRRISRFLELLQKKDKELIFIRRGHAIHHHKESELFKCEIKNEIDDCELLYALLKKKYTHLKFKIILFLECDKCFHQHHSDNIEIYNIVKGYNRDFFYIRLKNVLQKILNK